MWDGFISAVQARTGLELGLAVACLFLAVVCVAALWDGIQSEASRVRYRAAWIKAAQELNWWRRGYDELREELARQIAEEEAAEVRAMARRTFGG